ncbi:MAG: hypothetical protein U0836_15940 [Pirellulales bacterium]
MFVRFAVIRPCDEDSGLPLGLFQSGYTALEAPCLSLADQAQLRCLLSWFDKHLKKPDRFAKSRKPAAQSKAISWFKPTAREHIAQARELAELLRQADVEIVMSTTRTPGYIVYEDAHQVVAEPFRRG